jgi:hypothetical protein
MDVSSVVKQLKKERDRVERQLSGLNAALSAFVGAYGGTTDEKSSNPANPKRTISAASRKKMAAAQRTRWAKIRAKKNA